MYYYSSKSRSRKTRYYIRVLLFLSRRVPSPVRLLLQQQIAKTPIATVTMYSNYVSSCTVTKTRFLRAMSRRVSQPSLSNCSRILRAMILGLDYTVYTLLPIITMDQFSLKPTNRPNKPVLYSYNICAVPTRLELENGINRRPNLNQASVTVYHLYQFSPIFWHYFIGLQ